MSALLLALAFAQEAPRFDGELRTLELDAPGGVGGAPEGMVFIVPPGTQAEVYAGDLGGGVTGLRLRAPVAGDAVACTQAIAMSGGSAFVKARVRVPELQPGPADWHGATVEVRTRDATGALVSPPGLMFNPVGVVRVPGDWQEVQGKLTLPQGTMKGEVCLRLAVSTGTLEVDRLMVIAPRGAAPPPVAAVAVTAPAPAPVVAAAAPPPTAAPPPSGTPVGALNAPPGLVLDAPTVSSRVACSPWLPASRAIVVHGNITVATQDPNAVDWSGIVVEGYAIGAGGPLLTWSGAPYLPIRARALAGTESFSETWRPPAGARQVKVCLRVSTAAGTASVDWRGR